MVGPSQGSWERKARVLLWSLQRLHGLANTLSLDFRPPEFVVERGESLSF